MCSQGISPPLSRRYSHSSISCPDESHSLTRSKSLVFPVARCPLASVEHHSWTTSAWTLEQAASLSLPFDLAALDKGIWTDSNTYSVMLSGAVEAMGLKADYIQLGKKAHNVNIVVPEGWRIAPSP